MQTGKEYPWPINIRGKGEVNGAKFTMQGAGMIRCVGVYKATLNFSFVPPGFHPSAISMFVVSTCCAAGASERNGAKNMRTRGAHSYEARRELTFGQDKIVLVGKAIYSTDALDLDVDITGRVALPNDLCGHSVYVTRVEPDGNGHTKTMGEGSLFRLGGEEVKVQISSSEALKPDPLPHPVLGMEFRVATEDGELHGNSYQLTIHSIFDAHNAMSEVQTM